MHDTDLSTIEKRLHALEDRIAKTAAKSKSRLTLTIAVTVSYTHLTLPTILLV